MLLAAVLALLAVGLAWRLIPAQELPTVASLLATAETLGGRPWAPLAALLVFTLGALVVFPVNFLIAGSVLVFGPPAGALLALVGTMSGAMLLHEIGRKLPEQRVQRLLGARGERLRLRIAGHGFLAMAIVRVLPLAPYSVVSVVAGAARIPRLPYLLGSAVGTVPSILMYALFIDRARAVLVDPRPGAWLGLAAAALLLVAFALVARAWVVRRRRGAEVVRDTDQP